MKHSLYKLLTIILVLTFVLSGCSGLGNNSSQDSSIFSGFISTREVNVAPEVTGTAAEVVVSEGSIVKEGDVLFRLKDDILQAQYTQAERAVDTAKTAVTSAEVQYQNAQIQHEILLQNITAQESQLRNMRWQTAQPDEINLPVWYFQKDEEITALETELTTAQETLDTQQANLEQVLSDSGSKDFIETENRLLSAQKSFEIAKTTLEQAQASLDQTQLEEVAQKDYDTALSELKAAQFEYNRILSNSDSQDVLDARAQVAVAQTRVDVIQDQIRSLQTGDQSLQLKASENGISQAQAGIDQAKANLAQAEASLDLLKLQLDNTEITSPVSGVVLALNLEVGEIVMAGSTVMTIGQLDNVELTVYIPEDQYGRVQLGQSVILRSDSFPESTFQGEVTYIANEAEFTPRNVQTTSGRKTTVFAVKISVPNPDHKLKPGMPVDAEFDF